jgi:nucleoside-diphosphate-sugar epimerase
MKIAIVGASGFVGTRLCETLILEGRHAIRPLLRSPAGLARLARFRLDDWRITNALDASALEKDLEGCDVLVHAMVGDYGRIPDAARAAAQACVRLGVRLVYLSTASVHGQNPAPGTDESTPITDKQPLPYNAAKVRAELAIARVPNVSVCVLRPSIVFGPRSQWTIGLARALQQGSAYLVDGGQGICNSIYVDNLIHAIRIGFDHPRAGEGPFYVGDAEAPTWREFYRPLVEALGYAMDDVHTVPAVGPPGRTWQQRVGVLRQLRFVRRAFGRVPRRVKDAAIAAIVRYASGAPPSEFALPRVGPPEADYETSELHRCRTRLPMDRAVSVLGYQPVVSLADGLRRSAEFLLQSVRRGGTSTSH